MRSEVDLEDSAQKQPVTPGPTLPARELVGNLLLELSRPNQALNEFESSLRSSPNRLRGTLPGGRLE